MTSKSQSILSFVFWLRNSSDLVITRWARDHVPWTPVWKSGFVESFRLEPIYDPES